MISKKQPIDWSQVRDSPIMLLCLFTWGWQSWMICFKLMIGFAGLGLLINQILTIRFRSTSKILKSERPSFRQSLYNSARAWPHLNQRCQVKLQTSFKGLGQHIQPHSRSHQSQRCQRKLQMSFKGVNQHIHPQSLIGNPLRSQQNQRSQRKLKMFTRMINQHTPPQSLITKLLRCHLNQRSQMKLKIPTKSKRATTAKEDPRATVRKRWPDNHEN